MPKSGETTQICLVCKKSFGPDLRICPNDGSDLVAGHVDKLLDTVFADRYKILEVAGKGGMSTVYKAQHTYMDRTVAVKILHQHLVSEPAAVQRFQQEAKASSSLSHPNIINVFDFGVNSEGQAYLIMDYLDGCSLSHLLDQTGKITENDSIEIIRQTARGLAHAHKKGVIHRDLKPANLVLTTEEDGFLLVKLVDFGIAKVAPGDGAVSQHLTQTGEIFGSPLYMSPEQCEGKKVDARSDIYSFGCLIYELLSGAPPFVGDSAVDTIALHLNEKPIPLNEIHESIRVSTELNDLVMKCLKKDPRKRFQTVLEFMDAMPANSTSAPLDSGSDATIAMQVNTLMGQEKGSLKTPSSRYIKKQKRSRLKFSNEEKVRYLSIALASLIGFITLYQGPDQDPGSPLAKMTWQMELSFSQLLLASGLKPLAVPVLEFAAWHCEHLDPIFNRPNYDKRFQTLKKLAEAYNANGQNSKYERVVKELSDLDKERWLTTAKATLNNLSNSEKYIAELKRRREPIQSHLSEPLLNWAASVKAVVEIARRLDANYAYELEYQLLVKAEKIVTELYGPNFVGLAELKSQRAICLQNQDRITAIDLIDDDSGNEDGIYGRIREIYAFNARQQLGLKEDEKLSFEQIAEDPDFIRSILRLGQWQRRRGRFEEAGRNIELAMKAAEKYNKFEPDALAEFYSSYANYLHQMGKQEQSGTYLLKAREERKRSAAKMGMEYIEHGRPIKKR